MLKGPEAEKAKEDDAVQSVLRSPIINCPDPSSVVPIGIEEGLADLPEWKKRGVPARHCAEGCLFAEFVVELERFLGKFLVDREIHVK